MDQVCRNRLFLQTFHEWHGRCGIPCSQCHDGAKRRWMLTNRLAGLDMLSPFHSVICAHHQVGGTFAAQAQAYRLPWNTGSCTCPNEPDFLFPSGYKSFHASAVHRRPWSPVTSRHNTTVPCLLGLQDHLLLEINTDARYRHWLIYQPLCLRTGGVKVAISTSITLPLFVTLPSEKWA